MGLFYIKEQLRGALSIAYPTVKKYSRNNFDNFILAKELEKINVNQPTDLCRIMKNYRSDKGIDRHNYTTVYNHLFLGVSNDSLKIFELGIGTNNPNLLSSMGVGGKPGASLRGWRDYFPNSEIFGADIDRDILFTEDRIKTFYCDQLSAVDIEEMWNAMGKDEKYDIILEDGLHTFNANVSFFEGSINKLKKGGYYIIEDIDSNEFDNWATKIRNEYIEKYPNHIFLLVNLPTRRRSQTDNNLIIIC